jgi:hypothetical protein
MNGYYITADNPTEKVELVSQVQIYLPHMFLIELVLPRCKFVRCQCNRLTELIIPKTCELIYCYSNFLPKVIIDLFESNDPVKIQLANNLQLAKKKINK